MDRNFEKKFNELVNLLPQTVFEIHPGGKFVFRNQYGYETFGYKREEVGSGLSIYDLFIEEDRQRLCKNISLLMKNREPLSNEFTALKKGGETFHVVVHANPTPTEDGKTGIHGVIIDISDRKEVENKLKKSRDQFRNLSAHLQSIREEERYLIAREIHDELGQALTALKMDVIWIKGKLSEDCDEISDKLMTMSDLIDNTIQSVRRISTDLRPGLLDDLGLIAAIEWYSDEFQKRAGIECRLRFHAIEIDLNKDLSIAIFRIFQETLTNVARHAKARHIDVDLGIHEQHLVLEIHDDGIGITEEQIEDPKSLGLIGLRERVYPWNGSLKISGEKNRGTTVLVDIPLKEVASD